MQRLQRHATYGHLKQLVLRMIAEDVLAETETQATNMLTALRCGPPHHPGPTSGNLRGCHVARARALSEVMPVKRKSFW